MNGIYTALVTPFTKKGEVDFPSLGKILEQQVRLGIRGFVVCGTTGEGSTLSLEEKEALFRFVYIFSKGKKVEVVAGTGSNDTRESMWLTQLAESIGYRKFLIVVPYYNKPSQEGMRQHFLAIANATREDDSEIILYNVPGRTGVSLAIETVIDLAVHPKIRAIKEASGDLTYLAALVKTLAVAKLPLSLLSGDDATYYSFLRGGGHGVISVSSHVCPTAMIEIERSVKRGDFETADLVQKEFSPLFNDLFIESNPGPLKWMLANLGLCENVLRLPLVPVGPVTNERLKTTTQEYRIESEEYRR